MKHGNKQELVNMPSSHVLLLDSSKDNFKKGSYQYFSGLFFPWQSVTLSKAKLPDACEQVRAEGTSKRTIRNAKALGSTFEEGGL